MSRPLRSGNTEPGSILRDNTATIDLRHKPTRTDLGFRPGRNDRSYQREAGEPPIATTLRLPTGSLRIPAFVIAADAGDFTAAGEAVPRPPERIVVQRLFPTVDAATESLLADAAVLGLARPDVESLTTRVRTSLTTVLPQQGVLHGLVHGWLAASVEVIGYDDRTVGANYTFTIDEFHNDAIDRVVHEGVFPIDLTRTPSRAELAFRDTYPDTRVKPAWGKRLTAKLTLPGGVLTRPVTTVDSTTARGAGVPSSHGDPDRPSRTIVALAPTSVADLTEALRADAPALGIDPADVAAAFAASPGTHVRTTLHGRSTAVYDLEITVEATLGQPGRFAASARYRFTYR